MNRISNPYNVVLLLVLLVPCRLNSQEHVLVENSPWEEMFLHIDRERYIAGEELWISIYNTERVTGKMTDRSSIAYVELISPWDNAVLQKRFHLTGGRGEGCFLLPDSLSSGTYTIRAYTNQMKNFLPYFCYTQDIELFNPFRGLEFFRKIPPENAFMKGIALKQKPVFSDNHEPAALYIVSDTVYGRREKVTLKLKADDTEIVTRVLSIAITLSGASSITNDLNEDMVSERDAGIPDPDKLIKNQKRYGFESEGHFLTFMVKYREGSIPDSCDYLYMSIQGKVAEFNYARRDTSGRFTFIMPVDSKPRNLIIQPENATGNMILEIEPSFSGVLTRSHTIRTVLTEAQQNIFSVLSFNFQTGRIYGFSTKKESAESDNIGFKKRRFYGIPEREILMDDFIKLPVMQEVFFELVPGVILRSKRNGYELKITNPLTGEFYEEPPLVMIDGVIINDLAVIADLNPELVEKIEVIETPYLFGDLILHGIVNIITRSGTFSNATMPGYTVILPYKTVETSPQFTAPEYSDETKRSGRTPDLRNTLYWNPSVKTDKNGEAEIEFWTSDLSGKYLISIKGISGTGTKVISYKSFRIK